MAGPRRPKGSKPRRPVRFRPESLTIDDMQTFCRIYQMVRTKGAPLKELCKRFKREEKFVQNLEKRVRPPGATWKIVERDTTGETAPTDHGNDLYDRFQSILKAFGEFQESRTVGPTKVLVQTVRSSIPSFVADAYKKFVEGEKHPQAQVIIDGGFASDNLAAVLSRKAHIGIGFVKADSAKVEPVRLFETSMVLMHHRKKTIRRRPAEGPLDFLRRETVLMLPDESVLNSLINPHLPAPIRGLGRTVFLPSAVYLYDWVKRDLGVGFGFRDFIPEGDRQEIATMCLDFLPGFEPTTVWMYVRADWRSSYLDAAQEFAECIRYAAQAMNPLNRR